MLKKFILVALALSCSLFAPTSSYANPQPRPGPGIINTFAPCGGTIPKGVFAVHGNWINSSKDKVWVNGNSYDAKNEATFNLFAVKPRYGLGNGWDIRALIPFIANDFSAMPSRNGIGDSVFILRKQLISQNNFPVSVGMGIGTVIPTGSTSYDGLGSGAWGVLAEFGVTYTFDGGRQVVEANINYTYMGDGEAKTKAGLTTDFDQSDSIKMVGRYVIALNKNWDVGVEAQFENVFEQKRKRDSKGMGNASSSLFAGPTVTFKYPEWKTSVGITPQFALYHDYEAANRNGGGPSAEVFRIEAKLAKAF